MSIGIGIGIGLKHGIGASLHNSFHTGKDLEHALLVKHVDGFSLHSWLDRPIIRDAPIPCFRPIPIPILKLN